MSYTMFVPIDSDKMMQDVRAIASVKLPSGSDIENAIFIADHEDDLQQWLIYDLALSTLGRDALLVSGVIGTVVKAHRDFEKSRFGVDIRFADEQQAMLFKLTYG